MRLLTTAAKSMAACLLVLTTPSGAIPAHADAGGISDVYVFSANIRVTGASPNNTPAAAWWVGGGAAYEIDPTACTLAYSDPSGVTPEVDQGCSIGSSSFNVASAYVCGSGVGASASSLTLTEGGVDPDSTTLTSYAVVLLNGLGVLEDQGASESDSGAAAIGGVFTMVPIGVTPPGGGPEFGACTAQFSAIGVFLAVDTTL